MTHIQQLEKLLNVKIVEDYNSDAELQIYTQSTADGYEVYVITNAESYIDWENDVYYNEPSLNDIIERIEEVETYDDDPAIIYCSDIEEFFDEYEVENYIEQKKEDEK